MDGGELCFLVSDLTTAEERTMMLGFNYSSQLFAGKKQDPQPLTFHLEISSADPPKTHTPTSAMHSGCRVFSSANCSGSGKGRPS